MAEEKYDRKWHEGYDPKADKREYFLTNVIDWIDETGGTALKNVWEDERKLEGLEYLNPMSIGTFGVTRGIEGVGWILTNTPGVSQVVGGLAQAEDIAAGAAGELAGLVNVDPRIGGWGVRAATAWYGGPIAARGVAKVAKATGVTAKVSKSVSRVAGALDETAAEIAQRTRARRAHRWTRPGDKGTPIDKSDMFGPDDLSYGRGPNKKTYTQTHPRTVYPDPKGIPPDPWVDLSDFKMKLEDSINNPLYRNVDDLSLVDEVLAAGDDVIFPPDSQEAIIQKRYQAMAADSTGQLNVLFPFEATMSTRRGPANLGETVRLVADKSRKVKVRNFVKEDIDLTKYVTGYTQSGRTRTPTYDIDLFRNNIRDLIEADQIRASDIPVGQLSKVPGVTKKARKITGTTQVEELYGDYLAGYFNTYDTLDGAAVLKGAAGEVFPQITPALKRNLRLFKMNPEAFYSGHFGKTRTPEYNEKILELITSHKTTAEFLKGSKLQRHHLAVIDEIWPLFEGLRGDDVVTMRNMLKDVGIFLGNDPANLSLVPKNFHKVIHDVLWKTWRPKWAGKTKTAKRLQQDLKHKRAVDRKVEVEEFKESMDIINRQIELGVRKFVADQGKINANNINDLKNYLQDLVEMDLEAFD